MVWKYFFTILSWGVVLYWLYLWFFNMHQWQVIIVLFCSESVLLSFVWFFPDRGKSLRMLYAIPLSCSFNYISQKKSFNAELFAQILYVGRCDLQRSLSYWFPISSRNVTIKLLPHLFVGKGLDFSFTCVAHAVRILLYQKVYQCYGRYLKQIK